MALSSHPDAWGVDEVDLALAVDGLELGERTPCILVEAAVDTSIRRPSERSLTSPPRTSQSASVGA